jgi:Domain of unknown function (DUF4034)
MSCLAAISMIPCAAQIPPPPAAAAPPMQARPPVVFQTPPPGLPRGLIPGTIPDNDGPGALNYIGLKAESYFRPGAFSQLDDYIAELSGPGNTLDDGRPKLQAINSAFFVYFDAWKQWQWHLTFIEDWRKERPDSYAADILEAIIWRSWAWHARGGGSANTVSEEGWKLFNERAHRAVEVLDAAKAHASITPLWYEVRLAVARDLGADREEFMKIFTEASKRYPDYLPLYLAATNYLSPKWHGSYEDVDAFARAMSAVSEHGKRNRFMYARIYWHFAENQQEDFDLFRDSRASWPQLRQSFEDLMERYPKSVWNLNAFASFACRAGDGSTYAAERAKLGDNILSDAWPDNLPAEVCDARFLKAT